MFPKYKILIISIFFFYSCEDFFYGKEDLCGIRDGNNECLDCAGVPNGSAQDLGCGCGLPGPSGCDNECSSVLELDDCGVCDGNNECLDCAGIPNGSAAEDSCGVCSGGDTEIVPNLDQDDCGVCFGNNDCFCSDGITQKDCLGACPGDIGYPHSEDECGVCNGDNSSCEDCEGIPNGAAVIDCCDDCLGTAMLDDCGVCYGGIGSCADIEMNSCVGCMLEGADNYSENHTIPDNESCFVDYSLTIQPIFDNHCIGCHGNFGGLDLSSYQALMTGGNNGPSVIPNDAAGSILIEKINPNPTFGEQMGNLNQSTINKISTWIDLGALENN